MSDKPFNVADALGRLMNNKNLYQKLLDKFLAGYADYDKQVEEAIANKDLDTGMHLAHTMKGLAGNLGAEALQEASKNLEMLFKAGDPDVDFGADMVHFRTELKRALDAVASGAVMG